MHIPSLNKIINTVGAALDADLGTDACSRWTRHVKDALFALCPQPGCLVAAHGMSKKSEPEYLCDLVWSIEDNKTWTSYRGLALAVECEWNGGEDAFLYDFCKLLDVAAARRVFIGNLRPSLWTGRKRVLKVAATIAKQHRFFGKHDEIAVFVCEKGRKGRLDACVIRGDGTCEHLDREWISL